jgi:hypothetical protein
MGEGNQANWAKDFEEQGEHQVRRLLSSGGYHRGMRLPATEWLKRKNHEHQAKETAAEGERVAQAGRATARRRLATLAALVAGSAATLGAVVWLVGWLTS